MAGPDDVEATDDDEQRIVAEAGRALDPEVLHPDRILGRFAGLRVLPVAGRRTSTARRETTIVREPSGMVTVAGGKLTTYRRIAAEALEVLRPELGLRGVGVSPTPLPGAVDPNVEARAILRRFPELDAGTAAMLSRAYGSLASEVLSLVEREPALLDPVAAQAGLLGAQVVYAREREWALTAEDVLRRRTA